jgi:hypothetical protein
MSYVPNPPAAGHGLHDWILDFTRRELAQGLREDEVRDLTWKLTQGKGRRPATLSREIEDAVGGAVEWLAKHPYAKGAGKRYRSGWDWENEDYSNDESIRKPPPASKWQLPVNRRLIAKILGRCWPSLKPRGRFDLGELYAGFNYTLCLAAEVNLPKAQPLRDWQEHSSSAQWVVPNPFLRCGEGKGVKTDENAGERIWLIIEFDQGKLEDQAKLLLWLNRIDAEFELAMIVYSGGKSLHGWFSCVDKSEHREIFNFFRRATALGCDRSMRSSVQYTRMPLGMNSRTGRRQEIWHWSEEAISEHTQRLIKSQNSEF